MKVESGLTSAELTWLGGQLSAEVGHYTDMYQHDVIRTFWGDIEKLGAVVNSTDVAEHCVQIICTREFLESLGDFNCSVTYTATDRAGNVSQPSLGTPLHASVFIPENFAEPIIDPALGKLVAYAEACHGIAVDIPRYPDAAAGDVVILYWEGVASAPQPVSVAHEHNEVVLTFIVPYPTSTAKPEGLAHVRYEVKRDGYLFGLALHSSIDVFVTWPGPSDLAAPAIQGTSLNPNRVDNFSEEEDYELDSCANIKWNNGFAAGDELNLQWGDENIVQWYQIKASDISAQQDLQIPIAQSVMKITGSGSQIPVFYTLTRLSNPNPSKSPVQRVMCVVKKNRVAVASVRLANPTQWT